MNKVLNKLPALVAEELEAANVDHPPFHSLHEGWAVLKEEVDETKDNMNIVDGYINVMWVDVRADDAVSVKRSAENLKRFALDIAAEAIQVSAMAQKLIDYIEGGARNA